MSALPSKTEATASRRSVGMPLLAMGIIISAAIVAVATVQTSSARFAARTTNEGNLFTSAAVNIDVDSDSPADRQAELFLDGSGLYPGRELENCLRIVDLSSVSNLDVRLFAPLIEGELGRFFKLTISMAQTVDDECAPVESGPLVFAGTLAEFAAQYDSFSNGLELEQAANGKDIALLVTGALVDENEAQGLTVAYDILLEARPA